MSPRPSCSLPGIHLRTEEESEQPSNRRIAGLDPCLALLLAGVAWPFTLLWTPVVSYTIDQQTFRPAGHLFTLAVPAH